MNTKSSKTTVRRYIVLNKYYGGSNVLPQSLHVVNRFNRDKEKFSPEAQALVDLWQNESEVEIVLTGMEHGDLEDLYATLQKMPHIPSVKFNESLRANNGSCSAVLFVADERIAAGGFHLRNNAVSPRNAQQFLATVEGEALAGGKPYTEDEIFVISEIAFLKTA